MAFLGLVISCIMDDASVRSYWGGTITNIRKVGGLGGGMDNIISFEVAPDLRIASFWVDIPALEQYLTGKEISEEISCKNVSSLRQKILEELHRLNRTEFRVLDILCIVCDSRNGKLYIGFANENDKLALAGDFLNRNYVYVTPDGKR